MESKKEQIEKAKSYLNKQGYYNSSFMDSGMVDFIAEQIAGFTLSLPKEVDLDAEDIVELLLHFCNDNNDVDLTRDRFLEFSKHLLTHFKQKKEVDLDEFKEQWIKYCTDNKLNGVIKGWNFFLPHLQKPVDSDAVEFAEYMNDNCVRFSTGLWQKGIDFSTRLTTKELYEQFKQLKK